MEHFHSDWTFKPITMLHVNTPTERFFNEPTKKFFFFFFFFMALL